MLWLIFTPTMTTTEGLGSRLPLSYTGIFGVLAKPEVAEWQRLTTSGQELEVRCSIQLSYGRMLFIRHVCVFGSRPRGACPRIRHRSGTSDNRNRLRFHGSHKPRPRTARKVEWNHTAGVGRAAAIFSSVLSVGVPSVFGVSCIWG